MRPYDVEPYKFDKLLDLFSDDRGDVNRSRASLEARPNALYFKEYLDVCKATVLVIEHEYVDRDYLNDFAAYYVRCFTDMRKKAKRIHIFRNINFGPAEFEKAITREDQSLLNSLQHADNYIGFIVIKPLPETFIGRTCLMPYSRESGDTKHERHYPITTRYAANLFGLQLSVKTIAFQEQDKEVSACATSALWSLFHASDAVFKHQVPSPHAITLAASHQIADWQLSNPETRRFPSRGLTIGQIAGAIRDVGLEAYLIGLKAPFPEAAEEKKAPVPEILKPKNTTPIEVEPRPKAKQIVNPALYAYLSAGVPVLMTVKLIEELDGREPVLRGDHAVTVLGFGLDYSSIAPPPIQFNKCEVSFRSMRIDRLYVHDDQIGPFARMPWNSQELLETSWHSLKKRTIRAKPHCLFVPLSDRIRIPYETVELAIIQLNELIRTYVVQHANAQVEWEIRLASVNQFKSEILQEQKLEPQARGEILTSHFPKHLWLVTGYVPYSIGNYVKHIQFVIDATSLEQEGGLREIIPYDEFLVSALAQAAKHYTAPNEPSTLTRKLIERLRTVA